MDSHELADKKTKKNSRMTQSVVVTQTKEKSPNHPAESSTQEETASRLFLHLLPWSIRLATNVHRD
jgi:hypothetical protein